MQKSKNEDGIKCSSCFRSNCLIQNEKLGDSELYFTQHETVGALREK
jgi:hypothetical protein